jgi:hypothetical protein
MDRVERISGEVKRSSSAAPALERIQHVGASFVQPLPRPPSGSDVPQLGEPSPRGTPGHMPLLSRGRGPAVVKSRNGDVLSRGFILKTDFYPSGKFGALSRSYT